MVNFVTPVRIVTSSTATLIAFLTAVVFKWCHLLLSSWASNMYKDKQERIKQIQFTAYSLYQDKVYYEY